MTGLLPIGFAVSVSSQQTTRFRSVKQIELIKNQMICPNGRDHHLERNS